MVSIRLTNGEDKTNFISIHDHIKNVLPNYAVPVFLRIQNQMQTTGTFKYQKSALKKEGYDISKIQDAVYVLLPRADEYIPVTTEIRDRINNGKYKF